MTEASVAVAPERGVQRTVLPNGLTVLSEFMPGVRSVAIGAWVRSASLHETRSQMGISHFLEHMVFKGSETRSAKDIALSLESLGGSLDAYTGREHTSFQARVLDEHLPQAADVLFDLMFRPALREADLELERGVILEELAMVEDTPDDIVFEVHGEALWGDHPHGYSILGTPDSLAGITAADLQRLHRTGYYRGNCVIAAAGNVNHDQLLTVLEREGWFEGAVREAPRAGAAAPPACRGLVRLEDRDTAQTHIVLGSDTFPLRDPRRFAMAILVNVFGGGMSSRLFQRVREELGLAYAIYAYKSFYQGTGQLGVYVGTQTSAADQAVDAIRAEFDRVAREGLPTDELAHGKQQLKGQIMLSLESPGARMGRLAGFTLHDDRYRPLDEMLADIDAVTADEIAAVAGEFFPAERQTVVRLGPVGG